MSIGSGRGQVFHFFTLCRISRQTVWVIFCEVIWFWPLCFNSFLRVIVNDYVTILRILIRPVWYHVMNHNILWDGYCLVNFLTRCNPISNGLLLFEILNFEFQQAVSLWIFVHPYSMRVDLTDWETVSKLCLLHVCPSSVVYFCCVNSLFVVAAFCVSVFFFPLWCQFLNFF